MICQARAYITILLFLLGVCAPTSLLAAETKRPNQWNLWQQQIDQWTRQAKQMHSLAKQELKNIKPEFERRRQEFHAKGCDQESDEEKSTPRVDGFVRPSTIDLFTSTATRISETERDLDKALEGFLRDLETTRDNLASFKASHSSELSNLPAAQEEVDNRSRSTGSFFNQHYSAVLYVLNDFGRLGIGCVECDSAALEIEPERVHQTAGDQVLRAIDEVNDKRNHPVFTSMAHHERLVVLLEQAYRHCWEVDEASRDKLVPRFRALAKRASEVRTDALQRMRRWRDTCVKAKLFTGSGDAAIDAIYGQPSQFDNQLEYEFGFQLSTCSREGEFGHHRSIRSGEEEVVKYPDIEFSAFSFVATQASREVKEGVVPGAASNELP